MLMKLYPVGLSFIVDETLVSQLIDQNFCEFSVNVFSLLTPFVKSEICERQFSLFSSFWVKKLSISAWFFREIAKREQEFKT